MNVGEIETAELTAEERAAIAEDEGTSAPAQEPGGASGGQFEASEPAPVLRAHVPENADAILAQVAEFEANVERAFDDGDITAAEYRQHLAQASKKRGEVEWAIRKADLAEEMHEQARSRAWEKEVARFMSTTGANIAESRAAMLAFDEFVKSVTADPRHAHLSDRKQLELAHRLYFEDMASAGLPAGGGHRAGSGGAGFAALDRLAQDDPLAYEAALAGLSDDERERYAAA